MESDKKEVHMLTGERMVVREAARYWWVFLVTGVAWLIVGVLLGVVFLGAGINEVALVSVVPGGWKVWHIIMSIIFFLGALWGFIEPIDTFFALVSVLGLILIFYGGFEIIRAVASRPVNPYWWLGLIAGILLLLLAFWVSGSDRAYALAQRTYLILFWVGFFALFRGFTQIILAFSIRHEGKEAAAGLPA
jgi:uncharacterized membrane protein HdeD (DUF308 family)